MIEQYWIKHTPWNTVQGCLIPEIIQVCDNDILVELVELNTLIYVRPLNEGQILKLGHFEVWNFGTFFGYNDFFRNLGVLKQRSIA